MLCCVHSMASTAPAFVAELDGRAYTADVLGDCVDAHTSREAVAKAVWFAAREHAAGSSEAPEAIAGRALAGALGKLHACVYSKEQTGAR